MKKWVIEIFGGTNQGQVRERNEDNYFISQQEVSEKEEPPSFAQHDRGEEHVSRLLNVPIFVAVADGMGGHAGGDIASRLVAETLFSEQGQLTNENTVEAAKNMIFAAHQAILDAGAADYTLYDMGSTIVSLLFTGEDVIPLHVGDSRVYLYRPSAEQILRQLTKDHSEIRVLLELGFIKPEEAKYHPSRGVILKNLGMRSRYGNFEIEVSEKIKLCDGDLFLLCSDGLNDMLEDQEIVEIIAQWRDDLAGCGRALIQAANDKGGYDNITVILAAVTVTDTDKEKATDELQALPNNTSDSLVEEKDTVEPKVKTADALENVILTTTEVTGELLDEQINKSAQCSKPEIQEPFNQRKEAMKHETMS